MIQASIKSRPVYGRLEARSGWRHVFVADGDGAGAILDMALSALSGFCAGAGIDYVASGGGAGRRAAD